MDLDDNVLRNDVMFHVKLNSAWSESLMITTNKQDAKDFADELIREREGDCDVLIVKVHSETVWQF